MKEIKIKAWDKNANSFVPLWPLTRAFCEGFDCVQMEHSESIVPCMYIGQKDFNGVEIYESDIVEFAKLRQDLYTDWQESLAIELVTYDDDKCGFSANHCCEDGTCVPWPLMIVIGNLFENPELLD